MTGGHSFTLTLLDGSTVVVTIERVLWVINGMSLCEITELNQAHIREVYRRHREAFLRRKLEAAAARRRYQQQRKAAL